MGDIRGHRKWRVCVIVLALFPQVLVLELETRLQKERERLGELRKKHYELAGAAEGWGDAEEGEEERLGYNYTLVKKKNIVVENVKIH